MVTLALHIVYIHTHNHISGHVTFLKHRIHTSTDTTWVWQRHDTTSLWCKKIHLQIKQVICWNNNHGTAAPINRNWCLLRGYLIHVLIPFTLRVCNVTTCETNIPSSNQPTQTKKHNRSKKKESPHTKQRHRGSLNISQPRFTHNQLNCRKTTLLNSKETYEL